MVHISKVRNFSKDRDFDSFAVVRVSNSVVDTLGGRNAWVTIRGPHKVIYRIVRGSGDIASLSRDAIELDYDSRLDLDALGRPDAEGFAVTSLELARASALQSFLAHWRNPSLAYRVPFQIAIIALILGIVGAVLGVAAVLR